MWQAHKTPVSFTANFASGCSGRQRSSADTCLIHHPLSSSPPHATLWNLLCGRLSMIPRISPGCSRMQSFHFHFVSQSKKGCSSLTLLSRRRKFNLDSTEPEASSTIAVCRWREAGESEKVINMPSSPSRAFVRDRRARHGHNLGAELGFDCALRLIPRARQKLTCIAALRTRPPRTGRRWSAGRRWNLSFCLSLSPTPCGFATAPFRLFRSKGITSVHNVHHWMEPYQSSAVQRAADIGTT